MRIRSLPAAIRFALPAALAVACLSSPAAENMLLFQTQNEGFEAVPAPGAVMIDGDLADWDLSGRIWSFGDVSVRETHSVRTAAMWDAENLYLSFEWRDPTPMFSRVDPSFDPGRGWVSDAGAGCGAGPRQNLPFSTGRKPTRGAKRRGCLRVLPSLRVPF